MQSQPILELTPEQLTFAREWVKECQWGEEFTDEEIDELSDKSIIKGIKRHFCGGIESFKRSCE